ncbi:MAG: hypothetical protein E5299_01355 [Burkholderia gladioli]|nr:MAG: hypothetical protein E5299_01355 [Burkholderia gladioli]
MEARQWLPPAVACRECDVSVQDPHRQLSLGASHRLAGRRPRSPFAEASSTVWRTSLVRNPFVSPAIMPVECYCVLTLDLCNNTPLHPHARFINPQFVINMQMPVRYSVGAYTGAQYTASRAIVGVDADVVVRQVAGPNRRAGLAAAQQYADHDLALLHHALAVGFLVGRVTATSLGH